MSALLNKYEQIKTLKISKAQVLPPFWVYIDHSIFSQEIFNLFLSPPPPKLNHEIFFLIINNTLRERETRHNTCSNPCRNPYPNKGNIKMINLEQLDSIKKSLDIIHAKQTKPIKIRVPPSKQSKSSEVVKRTFVVQPHGQTISSINKKFILFEFVY